MLVYIDESGYPIPSDTNPISVLAAVCIEENKVRGITHAMYKLKDRLYGKQNEIKSTSLFNPKTIDKNRTINQEYANLIISFIKTYECHIFAIVMKRPEYTPYTPEGQLPVQYHKLLRRIDLHCYSVNAEKAICVFDETDDGRDKRYAVGFNNYLFRSQEGQALKKILVSPFFVSSSVTTTVEIADICAGLVRCYYQLGLYAKQPQTKYEEWISLLYSQLVCCTMDTKWKEKMYHGIYMMPSRCFKTGPLNKGTCEQI